MCVCVCATELCWKNSWYNHTLSTTLSKHVKLIKSGTSISPIIKLDIFKNTEAYKEDTKSSKLYLMEKKFCIQVHGEKKNRTDMKVKIIGNTREYKFLFFVNLLFVV